MRVTMNIGWVIAAALLPLLAGLLVAWPLWRKRVKDEMGTIAGGFVVFACAIRFHRARVRRDREDLGQLRRAPGRVPVFTAALQPLRDLRRRRDGAGVRAVCRRAQDRGTIAPAVATAVYRAGSSRTTITLLEPCRRS
jgi:hypothetical protein